MNRNKNDKEMGLLRMYEKLLTLSKNSDELNSRIEEYKKLAIKIYNRDLDSFNEKIKKFATEISSNISEDKEYEDEILELTQIIDSYYLLIQNRDRMNLYYKMYKGEELFLVGSIKYGLDFNIELYLNRKKILEEYVRNNKKISLNIEEIDRLKKEFSRGEKRKREIDNRILELNKILRDNFILSEGRILNNTSLGVKMEYTSVLDEYKNIGINLRCVDDKVNEIKDSIIKEEIEAKNLLDAASIVSNNIDINSGHALVLDDIKKDYLAKYYKKILIEIFNTINNIKDNYSSGLKGRIQLKELFEERENVLKELGYNYVVDPFTRIKLDSQLEEISSYENIDEIIDNINLDIDKLEDDIDKIRNENTILIVNFKDNTNLVRNNNVYSGDKSRDDIKDNEIVSIKDIEDKFRSFVVEDKTKRVISNVIDLINRRKEEEKDNPLEKDVDDYIEDEVAQVELLNPELTIEEEVSLEEEKEVLENESLVDNAIVEFIDMVPFEDAPIFTNRQDDALEVFNNNSSSSEKEEYDDIFPDLDTVKFEAIEDKEKDEKINLKLNLQDESSFTDIQDKDNLFELIKGKESEIFPDDNLADKSDKKEEKENEDLFFEYRDTSNLNEDSEFDLTEEVENLLNGKSR